MVRSPSSGDGFHTETDLGQCEAVLVEEGKTVVVGSTSEVVRAAGERESRRWILGARPCSRGRSTPTSIWYTQVSTYLPLTWVRALRSTRCCSSLKAG